MEAGIEPATGPDSESTKVGQIGSNPGRNRSQVGQSFRKPTGRLFGSGGLFSARMASKMTLNCASYWRSSASSLRARPACVVMGHEAVAGEDQIAQMLAATPRERLRCLAEMVAFEARAHRARRVSEAPPASLEGDSGR